MKLLYVAPRYHTNQIPIMKGWIENGHQVVFVSQMTNKSEDHRILTPIVLGYSRIFKILFRIRSIFKRCILPDEFFAFCSKKGFPPYFKLMRIIKRFMPDVAILRERSMYTMVSYLICKRFDIPCILYNQSPYWNGDLKHSIIKEYVKGLFPIYRMTPVLGNSGKEREHNDRTYYIPFVMEPHFAIEEKEHFIDNKVQIICVAGYHDRKRLPLLIDAICQLEKKYSIHLCVVGEVITEDQEMYYKSMVQYVKKVQQKETIILLKNYKREQIFEQYRKSDLFVLPSTRERASISQLEAMSCSLPVICSNTNGSACHIEDGGNGYIFEDDSLKDLVDKIETIIKDKDELIRMGQRSYELICREYSFDMYKRGILQILEAMKEELK